MQFLKKVLLFCAPCLAISMVTVSPSKAATLANSEGNFLFTNFSQNPSTVSTNIDFDANVNAIGIFEDAKLSTEANADAVFVIDPALGYNVSSTSALGEVGAYIGTAESEATIRGVFDITADTNFKFDFFGDLTLDTSIDYPLVDNPSVDNPYVENARANGNIFFTLVDVSNNQTIDYFSLVGNLTTAGDNDFIGYDNSEYVLIDPYATSTDYDFGENQEYAEAYIVGSYDRYFANNTTLALVEVKRNKVEISAVPEPEPSANPALLIATLTLFSCGALMVKPKLNKPSQCIE
ncbi:hypothetical protein [Calothrix rhizosoleniae]|nr:hypothetical protein [Calothrix rhizosoleniae]